MTALTLTEARERHANRVVSNGHLFQRFQNSLDSRTCKVRISSEVAAEDGMIVVTRGISLQRYLKNPIVQLWHDTQSPAVARMRDLQLIRSELHGVIAFPPEGAVPESDQACRLVKNGLLSGVSIGFSILESQPLPSGLLKVTRSNLYEVSLCNVPMVEDCLVYQRSASTSTAARRRSHAAELKARFARQEAALHRSEISRRELAAARREEFQRGCVS